MTKNTGNPYTWKMWRHDHKHAVFLFGLMLAGMLVIGFVNGWK